jgi:hypothetical protein
MPQVDNTLFLTVVLSFFKWSAICYGIILVYMFYPFTSAIKVSYNYMSKVRQIKHLLVHLN